MYLTYQAREVKNHVGIIKPTSVCIDLVYLFKNSIWMHSSELT